jgi:hypothetical protein
MNARLNPRIYMEFSGLIFDCENGLTRVKIVPRCVVIVTISLDRIRLYTVKIIYNTPRANNFNEVKSQF